MRILVLIIFIISCRGQSQTETANSLTQPGSELTGVAMAAVEKKDTLSILNAPSRITRKIRKNQEGNLLIASFEDVIQYDGESFSKIPKVKDLESIDAFDALEDTKGNIWIASTHYGVFRYDGKGFTHFTEKNGLVHDRTMDLFEDRLGNIWIGTMGGISCYDGESFRNFTTKDGLTNNDVNTIVEDQTGKIWIGTRGTACMYDPSSSTFVEIVSNEREPLKNIWSIIEDKHGAVWLAGTQGIWCYANNSMLRISDKGGNALFEDKKGNIWVTHTNGLSFFSKESTNSSQLTATDIFMDKGMFFGIAEDRDGNIWIGTLNGVLSYTGSSIHYYHDPELD